MRTTPLLAVLGSLATTAAAQLPHDGVLVLEGWAPGASNLHWIVDAFGRGGAPIPGQTLFGTTHGSLSVDPIQPANYFAHGTGTGAVTSRMQIGPGGGILGLEGMVNGPWFSGAAARIEVGDQFVFALRNGGVDWCDRLTTFSTGTLFSIANAVDLATRGPQLFVATNNGALASPVVEWTFTTSQPRLIGNYVGVTAIAASPVANQLSLGLDTGAVMTVDELTGQVLAVTPATLPGAVRAIGYTRQGARVWANSQRVWSELSNSVIHVTYTSIVDLAVCRLPTASVTVFGAGCGVSTGAAAKWAATSLPLLGNQGFELMLWNLGSTQPIVLALGASRSFSSVLGQPLPLPMQPFGAPIGCSILADPLLTLVLVPDSFHTARWAVPIPNNPALVDVEFAAQGFKPDPVAGWLGLAPTSGLAFVIR